MPANQYFKAAASDIYGAIQERRREMEDLRKQMDRQEVDTKHKLDDLRTERQQKESQVASGSIDNDALAAKYAVDVRQLGKTISETENYLREMKRKISEDIQRRQQEIMGLERQARDFESRAASS